MARHPLVEQRGERADHAGLRLAALAEEDHVVAARRAFSSWGRTVLVALHHREQRLAGLDALVTALHRTSSFTGTEVHPDLAGRPWRERVRGSRGHGVTYRRPPCCCPRAEMGTVSAVRMRWFVTMATIVVATAALTAVLSNGFDRGSGSEDQVVASSETTLSTTGTTASTATGVSSPRPRQRHPHRDAPRRSGARAASRDTLTVDAERGLGNGGGSPA